VLAATLLRQCEAAASEREAKKNIVQAIEQVAAQLGNTRAVCRKCYVHPAVIDSYLDGSIGGNGTRARAVARAIGRLTDAEKAVLALLQRRLKPASP
jgi:DNA topoisomerase-1